jgi:hypothetical protein
VKDPTLRLVAGLPETRPDPQRDDRIRRRCRDRLAHTSARPARRARSLARGWAPALAALGVAYFLASVQLALRLAVAL